MRTFWSGCFSLKNRCTSGRGLRYVASVPSEGKPMLMIRSVLGATRRCSLQQGTARRRRWQPPHAAALTVVVRAGRGITAGKNGGGSVGTCQLQCFTAHWGSPQRAAPCIDNLHFRGGSLTCRSDPSQIHLAGSAPSSWRQVHECQQPWLCWCCPSVGAMQCASAVKRRRHAVVSQRQAHRGRQRLISSTDREE